MNEDRDPSIDDDAGDAGAASDANDMGVPERNAASVLCWIVAGLDVES